MHKQRIKLFLFFYFFLLSFGTTFADDIKLGTLDNIGISDESMESYFEKVKTCSHSSTLILVPERTIPFGRLFYIDESEKQLAYRVFNCMLKFDIRLYRDILIAFNARQAAEICRRTFYITDLYVAYEFGEVFDKETLLKKIKAHQDRMRQFSKDWVSYYYGDYDDKVKRYFEDHPYIFGET